MNLERHWQGLYSSDRKVTMASALVLTRAVPSLRFQPRVFRWTLVEAKRWVGLLQHGTSSLTAARRASAMLDLSWRSVDPPALVAEARRHFDLVSARDRVLMPALWGSILLETEPSALRATLPAILEATRMVTRSPGFWLLDERMPEDARAIIRAWFDGLKDWEVEPGVRLRFAAREALLEIQARRMGPAADRLREMTRWAPYCPYPASHLDVLRAAVRFPVLRAACASFIEVALNRERDSRKRRALRALRQR